MRLLSLRVQHEAAGWAHPTHLAFTVNVGVERRELNDAQTLSHAQHLCLPEPQELPEHLLGVLVQRGVVPLGFMAVALDRLVNGLSGQDWPIEHHRVMERLLEPLFAPTGIERIIAELPTRLGRRN